MSSSFNSLSPPFVIPHEYQHSQIKKLQAYDQKSQNLGLQFMNARHCFCIITFEDDKQVKLQAGKIKKTNKVGIGYQKYFTIQPSDRKIAQINVQGLSFSTLGYDLKSVFQNRNYEIVDMNCYTIICNIFRWYGNNSSEAFKILKKNCIQIRKGTSAVTAIQGGIGGGIIGAMGVTGAVGASAFVAPVALGVLIGGIVGKTYGWVIGKIFIQK